MTPRRVEKPWGYEVWWADTDLYAAKFLHITRGHELSLQRHRQKDETSYVLEGRLVLTSGASITQLTHRGIGPGFNWRVRPSLIHSIRALEDAVVAEVSTPHLNDVVRLRDRYGRAASPADIA